MLEEHKPINELKKGHFFWGLFVIGLLIIAGFITVIAVIKKTNGVVSTSSAATPSPEGLQVEVLSYHSNPIHNTIEVDAVMSGIGLNPNLNSASGSYKTPITFKYPMNSGSCNGVGLVELPNSALYHNSPLGVYDNGTIRNFNPGSATESLIPFPHLIPFAASQADNSFLFGSNGGYVYAMPWWDRTVIETQRAKGSLADASWHIDEGSQYAILRDTSLFLRNPEEYIVGSLPTMPCSSSDVIATGWSQAAARVHGLLAKKYNSKIGAESGFDNGKVFEGSLLLDIGGCADMAQGQYESAYSCPGATAESEGKVITLMSEMGFDVNTYLKNWNQTLQSRPGNDTASDGWYRVYEMAGTGHLPVKLLDGKVAGLRRPAAPTQAYFDWSPITRKAIVDLTSWVKTNTAPTSSNTYFTLDANKSPATGIDGNAIGGIRSPNVRTKLPSGEEFGAPLGVYKGAWLSPDNLSVLDAVGGYFTPYASLGGANNKCSTYYPTHQAYTDAVTKAIDYGISQGWYLAEDKNIMIQTAEQDAITYGAGCVPAL